MAGPQDDPQKITADRDGYVTLSDGRRVPTLDTYFNNLANNPQGFGPQEQRTQLSQGYSKYVAQPVTDALGNFLDDPVNVAESIGLISPETARTGEKIAHGAASVVVPQDLTQLGIDAGVVASGGAMAPLKVGRGLSAAGRVLGGTAGGAVGGYAETGDVKGAVSGAGRGLVQAGAAETLGQVVSATKGLGLERVKRQVQDFDAANTAQALTRVPKLKGVFNGVKTAADLEDLAKGTIRLPDGTVTPKGMKLLGDYMDKQHDLITQALDRQQAQFGRSYQFPLALEKTDGGRWVMAKPGRFGSWEDARQALSELGRRAYGGSKGNVLEPTMAGYDLKQVYQEYARTFRQQLSLVDAVGVPNNIPSTLKAFNDGQGVYEAGRALLKKVLRPAFATKTAGRVAYNSDAVQALLADKRADLQKALGPEGYDAIARANRITPETMGQIDIYQPGQIGTYLREGLPLGTGNLLPQAPQLLNTPRTLSEAAKTGVSLLGSQLGQPAGQSIVEPILNDLMRPGVPGPTSMSTPDPRLLQQIAAMNRQALAQTSPPDPRRRLTRLG